MARIKDSLLREAERRVKATTLAELAAARVRVFCRCNRCGHNASLDSARLVADLGAAVPVPEAGARLRCTGCGSKDIATRPAWPGLGAPQDRAKGTVANSRSSPASAEPSERPTPRGMPNDGRHRRMP